jgi:MFS family permease
VTFYYMTLLLQGTFGYSAAAAGVATAPGVIFMVLFSARFGALAARYGARWFMTAGPALMALGVLWFARIPATSPPWALSLSAVDTFAPPAGYVTGILPGLLLFGLGAMLMVAPLTATLMASVPVEHAGVASAINNAVSDVGPQLAVAALFVVLTAHFYAALAGQVPGLDVASPAVRREIAPLNLPGPGTSEAVRRAAREASTGAFHLAMLVAAALLLGGAAINAAGIRTPAAGRATPVVSPDPSFRRWCRLTAEAPAAPPRDAGRAAAPRSTSSSSGDS